MPCQIFKEESRKRSIMNTSLRFWCQQSGKCWRKESEKLVKFLQKDERTSSCTTVCCASNINATFLCSATRILSNIFSVYSLRVWLFSIKSREIVKPLRSLKIYFLRRLHICILRNILCGAIFYIFLQFCKSSRTVQLLLL